MHACHFLESAAVVLSAAAAVGHLGVTQAVRELLRFLSLSQSGLVFLVAQPSPANVLLRLMASMADAEAEDSAFTGGEGGLMGPGFGEEGFTMWLMQALHALQSVSELMSHVASGGDGRVGLEEGDNADVLGILNALYLMTFTQTGRSAVAHVFSLENNLSCLVTLLQHYGKDGQGYTDLFSSMLKICLSSFSLLVQFPLSLSSLYLFIFFVVKPKLAKQSRIIMPRCWCYWWRRPQMTCG